MLISNILVCGLMPNLIKKSWTVSSSPHDDVVYGRHLSQIMVSAPALAALMAALNPLGPPPTTKTEHLAKTGTCFGSSEIDKKRCTLHTSQAESPLLIIYFFRWY